MRPVGFMQALAYVMQLVGVAVVSVPISWTGMLHYPRQTKIHYSVGLLVQALAFIQVHPSQGGPGRRGHGCIDFAMLTTTHHTCYRGPSCGAEGT